MPINSFLYPGAKVTTGYNVDNSLRFNRASSDNLSATLTTDNGDVHKWTYSFWFKRSTLGSDQQITSAHYSGSYAGGIVFRSTDQFEIFDYRNNSFSLQKKTNRLFRVVSAWYHIVISNDNSVSSPDLKIYVNGVEETSFATDNEYSQNEDNSFNNSAYTNRIGAGGVNNDYIGGYLSEFCFIDGTALDATSFGEFDEDSGIWKPIDVSGLTFGTNGFYLDFENSGSLGADVSGNGNNFTVNNLTAIDQSTDTCTNNFATWNSLDNFYQSNTYSEGNLQVQTQNTSFTYNFATIGVSTGKWYWEVEYDAKSGGTDQPFVGITSTQPTSNDHELGNFPNDFAWYTDNGTGYLSNNNTYSNVGFNAYTVGDVISVALDLDNNKLYFAKNGTWEKSGNPESGSTGTGAISITATASTPLGAYFPSVADGTTSYNATFKTNFGSPPFTISSGNTDGNGYGNFEYAVPSGYYSLNSKNLAEYG